VGSSEHRSLRWRCRQDHGFRPVFRQCSSRLVDGRVQKCCSDQRHHHGVRERIQLSDQLPRIASEQLAQRVCNRRLWLCWRHNGVRPQQALARSSSSFRTTAYCAWRKSRSIDAGVLSHHRRPDCFRRSSLVAEARAVRQDCRLMLSYISVTIGEESDADLEIPTATSTWQQRQRARLLRDPSLRTWHQHNFGTTRPIPARVLHLPHRLQSSHGKSSHRLHVGIPLLWRLGKYAPLPTSGAYHGTELQMLFGTSEDFSGLAPSAEQVRLMKVMRVAWVAFATSPLNGLSRFRWPEFELGKETLVRLGFENRPEPEFVRPEVYSGHCSGVVLAGGR